MEKSIVFLFTGQGSQYYQMGRELYQSHPVFRHWMKELDRNYYNISGKSVIGELYGNDHKISKPFDPLGFTHPAIFMVEYALAKVLIESGIYPEYVFGSSMGEFAAVAIAGLIDYVTALECLVIQADLVQKHCEPGGMLAILDHDSLYYEEPLLYKNCELASVNFDTHIVVTGGSAGISDVETYVKNRQITYQVLPIHYGFHSRWIDEAGRPYKQFLSSISLKSPQLKVISSLKGKQCSSFKPEYLWDVVREPIHFRDAVKSLVPEEDHIYVDLSPSGTLANFIKHNIEYSTVNHVNSILSPFHKDLHRLEQVIARIKVSI